jgi:hypothetical protein
MQDDNADKAVTARLWELSGQLVGEAETQRETTLHSRRSGVMGTQPADTRVTHARTPAPKPGTGAYLNSSTHPRIKGHVETSTARHIGFGGQRFPAFCVTVGCDFRCIKKPALETEAGFF